MVRSTSVGDEGDDESDDDLDSDLGRLLRAAARSPAQAPLDVPAQAHLAVGDRLGPYVVVAELGRGGMGVVFEATDERSGRAVALKVLPALDPVDASRRKRFAREAGALSAIRHENVAGLLDAGETERHVYLAMEIVRGKTLREWPLSQPSLRDRVAVARDVARGLVCAHAQGVVHRDLKPDNVMVDDAGVVKILDFGLAKLVEDGARPDVTGHSMWTLTRPGQVVGTPAYMSPEQASGRPVDARSDLFSLGTLLYEMLTGVRPFHGQSAWDVLRAVAREPAPPLETRAPDASPALVRLVARCLEKAPEARHPTASDLVRDLDALPELA